MGITPARHGITFRQGSTYDETFIFYLPRASESDPLVPMPLAGWHARMAMRKDFDGPAILELQDGVAAPPDADGIHLGAADGTVRIYIRAATTAAIAHTAWTKRGTAPKDISYIGVWDFELVNPAGEPWRELEGEVVFSREVTR